MKPILQNKISKIDETVTGQTSMKRKGDRKQHDQERIGGMVLHSCQCSEIIRKPGQLYAQKFNNWKK